MITSITIEKLCLSEDQHADHEGRAAQLTQTLDLCDSQGMNAVIIGLQNLLNDTAKLSSSDVIQLGCEAVKFHRLRQSGLGLHQAMDRMFAC